MTSSKIHYKFSHSATLGHESVKFEGPTIRLGDLKKLILARLPEGGKDSEFDLEIRDAQRPDFVFAQDATAVPKNTTVLVRRVPLPAHAPYGSYRASAQSAGSASKPQPPSLPHAPGQPIVSDDFGGDVFGEREEIEQRLKKEEGVGMITSVALGLQHVPQRATMAGGGRGGAQKFASKASNAAAAAGLAGLYTGPKSDLERGSAPTRPTRGKFVPGQRNAFGESRAEQQEKRKSQNVGVPRAFLEARDPQPDDNGVVPTSGPGVWLKIKPDEQRFLQKQKPKVASLLDLDEVRKRVDPEQVPAELRCKLSGELLQDAVMLACCFESCSFDKIVAALVASGHVCPLCGKQGVTPDTLSPNEGLRARVRAFLESAREQLDPGASAAAQSLLPTSFGEIDLPSDNRYDAKLDFSSAAAAAGPLATAPAPAAPLDDGSGALGLPPALTSEEGGKPAADPAAAPARLTWGRPAGPSPVAAALPPPQQGAMMVPPGMVPMQQQPWMAPAPWMAMQAAPMYYAPARPVWQQGYGFNPYHHPQMQMQQPGGGFPRGPFARAPFAARPPAAARARSKSPPKPKPKPAPESGSPEVVVAAQADKDKPAPLPQPTGEANGSSQEARPAAAAPEPRQAPDDDVDALKRELERALQESGGGVSNDVEEQQTQAKFQPVAKPAAPHKRPPPPHHVRGAGGHSRSPSRSRRDEVGGDARRRGRSRSPRGRRRSREGRGRRDPSRAEDSSRGEDKRAKHRRSASPPVRRRPSSPSPPPLRSSATRQQQHQQQPRADSSTRLSSGRVMGPKPGR